MSHAKDAVKLRPDDMKNNIPGPGGEQFHTGLLRGELKVEFYVPQNEDLQ